MTVRILQGDCREVLATLPEASIDSCVCDPPYHLTTGKKGGTGPASVNLDSPYGRARITTGFMGQAWDGGDVAFRPETWASVFRVLKPGAHLLAFSGTRTYHRMACAIEDAGFEVRDQIGWAYGCLDETSEILTADGWRSGLDVRDGDLVAAWDPETGSIALRPVLETFRAPFNGRMVAFRNDNTDQLLTPNHRVYARHRQRRMEYGARLAWYDDAWTVQEACEINRWNSIQLPVAGIADGEGIGGTDYAALLGWIWTEGGFDKTGRGVRIYQSESANPEKVTEIQALVARIVPNFKRYDRTRDYVYGNTARAVSETCWFFTGDIADQVRADLPRKSPSWQLLWQMTACEKEAFLDAAMKGDGSSMAFYQDSDADLEWFQALLHLTGRQGRINRPKRCVAIHNNPKTELQSRHLRHDGEEYAGDVWCVRVETGAFVARRNGKAFITGNSGFPKSLDVSTAIDKAAGAKGSLGEYHSSDHAIKRKPGNERSHEGYQRPWRDDPEAEDRSLRQYIPATPEAAAWQGWGTALKPAWEPICVARKPLAGTVAQSVLAHGTGALNIDGCRIGTSKDVPASPARKANGAALSGSVDGSLRRCTGEEGGFNPNLGRWPANLLHDGSPEVLACFPETKSGGYPPEGGQRTKVSTYGKPNARGEQKFTASEGSAARFFQQCEFTEDERRLFYCAKASRAERGEGNDHPTVKPIALMRWLVRLVTPPGGHVIDPFAGSGTTGIAAGLEQFRATLIEMDPKYADIAQDRLNEHLGMFARAAE